MKNTWNYNNYINKLFEQCSCFHDNDENKFRNLDIFENASIHKDYHRPGFDIELTKEDNSTILFAHIMPSRSIGNFIIDIAKEKAGESGYDNYLLQIKWDLGQKLWDEYGLY